MVAERRQSRGKRRGSGAPRGVIVRRGRSGLGAVMGSKKLKLIAVKGDQTPEMANREKILEMATDLNKKLKEKPTPFSISTPRRYTN